MEIPRLLRMRPALWLLLAIGLGVGGLIEGWLIINLLLPLAGDRPAIVYYAAEDRISANILKCDAAHRQTAEIPLDPPMTFHHIRAGFLIVCERLGDGQSWIYAIKTDEQFRSALEHIEQLVVWHDHAIIGGLILITSLPILFCLVVAAANMRRTAL